MLTKPLPLELLKAHHSWLLIEDIQTLSTAQDFNLEAFHRSLDTF